MTTRIAWELVGGPSCGIVVTVPHEAVQTGWKVPFLRNRMVFRDHTEMDLAVSLYKPESETDLELGIMRYQGETMP